MQKENGPDITYPQFHCHVDQGGKVTVVRGCSCTGTSFFVCMISLSLRDTKGQIGKSFLFGSLYYHHPRRAMSSTFRCGHREPFKLTFVRSLTTLGARRRGGGARVAVGTALRPGNFDKPSSDNLASAGMPKMWKRKHMCCAEALL